ncbi:hypothetical protein KPATCC21470_6249 [Kitasatospora purpeofusca]
MRAQGVWGSRERTPASLNGVVGVGGWWAEVAGGPGRLSGRWLVGRVLRWVAPGIGGRRYDGAPGGEPRRRDWWVTR